jgi:hypothetical protein
VRVMVEKFGAPGEYDFWGSLLRLLMMPTYWVKDA